MQTDTPVLYLRFQLTTSSILVRWHDFFQNSEIFLVNIFLKTIFMLGLILKMPMNIKTIQIMLFGSRNKFKF